MSSSTGPFGGFVIVPGGGIEVVGVKGFHLLKKPCFGTSELGGGSDFAEELRLLEEPLREGSGVVAGVA